MNSAPFTCRRAPLRRRPKVRSRRHTEPVTPASRSETRTKISSPLGMASTSPLETSLKVRGSGIALSCARRGLVERNRAPDMANATNRLRRRPRRTSSPSEIHRRGHDVRVDAGSDFLSGGDAAVHHEPLWPSHAIGYELQRIARTPPHLRSAGVTIKLIADMLRPTGKTAIGPYRVPSAVDDDLRARATRAEHRHLRGSVELPRRMFQQRVIGSERQ